MNLLNLPDWKIAEVETSDRDYRVHATYLPEPSACIHCGKGTLFAGKLYRHGTRQQLLMDLPAHGKRVGILLTRSRYRCQDCGKTFLQPLPDVDDRGQLTKRLVAYIEEQSVIRTFTNVADEVGVNEKTVRNIFNAHIDLLDRTVKFYTPTTMGIDEVHLLRKPRCVITNVEDRTIIGVLEERTKKAVRAHLAALEDKHVVEVVTMDMWKPYFDSVKETLPDAAVVIDKFHVVRLANQCLEVVRKTIRASLEPKVRRKLMHDRFVLLRRAKDLKDEDRAKLESWTKAFPELGEAYRLKEEFFAIYDHKDRGEAFDAYEKWQGSIPRDMLTHFRPVLTAMYNWRTPIFAYFDHRATNACTEALNGIAKNIERSGRGYSFKVIRAKMLYSRSLQKKPRQARYGSGFEGRVFIPSVEPGPPPRLGTDIDALLRVLEQGQQESQKSTR